MCRHRNTYTVGGLRHEGLCAAWHQVNYTGIRGVGCTLRQAFPGLSDDGNCGPSPLTVAIKINLLSVCEYEYVCVCVSVCTCADLCPHLFGGQRTTFELALFPPYRIYSKVVRLGSKRLLPQRLPR